MIGRFIAGLVALLSVLACIHLAAGAPPAGSDPNSAIGQWFRSLMQPGSGASCCDYSDCRGVRSRIGAEGYEVMVDLETFAPADADAEQMETWRATWKAKFGDYGPHWVKVPKEKILQGKDNPLGRAVVCWTPSKDVICFVKPTEA